MGQKQVPSYRRHSSGQAFVEIRGHRKYLGVHGSAKSKEKYRRVLAEWLATGAIAAPETNAKRDFTVNELIDAFYAWAETRYVKNGEQTTEVRSFKTALQTAVSLYGSVPTNDFGPLALTACRAELVKAGHCRTQVNGLTSRIRRCFKWGVSREMVKGETWTALTAVEGLRAGESTAREMPRILPVSDAQVDAAMPFAPPQVRAMVELQLCTGARPGEICQLRMIDLDMRESVWEYVPGSHKTEHHGRARVILIGPRAQEVLKQWFRTELEAPLFSPAEAREWMYAQRREKRKTPVQPSQVSRRKRNPARRSADHYTTQTYGAAIKRACRLASIPAWAPNRLRHSAATKIRAASDIEGSRVILGHSSAVTSEIYAEVDREKARRIMGEIG